MDILKRVFYGNTLGTWLIALAVFLISLALLSILKTVILRRFRALARRTATDIDDFIAELFRRIKFYFLIALALYFGLQLLSLPAAAKAAITKLMIIALLFQGAVWGGGLFDYWRERASRKKGEVDAASKTTHATLSFLFRIALWSIVLLLALENLGVNVTALVAGLGVGGVAVALALQNVLGDLFAHISILLDKPFVLDDFIIVDEHMGTVQHIGLKTTRLRSLGGEQLVFANSDLLKSRIRNYKRMEERRILFSLGVIYQTPAEKLAAIPGMIREIVEAQNLARFDRSNFKDFGDFSLNFETVYYVLSPDYNTYMNIQEAINLAVFRRFAKEGIEFAYPTRTIFLEKPPLGGPGQ